MLIDFSSPKNLEDNSSAFFFRRSRFIAQPSFANLICLIRCNARVSMIYSVSGPLAMVMPYLMEFHSAKYKPHFITWTGFLFAVANIIPAGEHAIARYIA